MAAGSTYTPLATTTISGSSTTSVTFSSISSAYTDLVIVMGFSLSANDEIDITFNGDTGANYSRTYMEGDGTSASSAYGTGLNAIAILGRGNLMTNLINIMSYSNTNIYKTVLARFSSPSNINGAETGLWRSTSAITSVTLNLRTSKTYVAGSVITLYGIAAA
jgi:hypothetical protein